MSHKCVWSEGECERCVEEAAVDHRSALLKCRGRWLVVDDGGCAMRFRRKSSARKLIADSERVGIRARLMRWNRSRVHLPDSPFAEYEASDKRWLP